MNDLVTKTCRCGAQFVQRPHHRTGKFSPITVAEHAAGNVAINENGSYRIIAKGEAYDGPRHVNHFSNCPEAGSFAKGK